jgi:histidyl-tRNA synthetase
MLNKIVIMGRLTADVEVKATQSGKSVAAFTVACERDFGEKETDYSLPIVALLRKQGIRCEIYPDSAKMKKQMQYANQKAVPFVAMTGETEMAEGKVMLKNMLTGEQKLLLPEEIADAIN